MVINKKYLLCSISYSFCIFVLNVIMFLFVDSFITCFSFIMILSTCIIYISYSKMDSGELYEEIQEKDTVINS